MLPRFASRIASASRRSIQLARMGPRALPWRALSSTAPSLRPYAARDESAAHKFKVIDEEFGSMAFTEEDLALRVPKSVMERLADCKARHQPMSPELADVVAQAVLQWSVERGATHFTHWFQPLTGGTGQKHDTFLKRISSGRAISALSGKDLVRGEPDASSFPTGGLHTTHEARGYTVWDPSSPLFLVDHGNGRTLYIPSVFISWFGHALDEKLPLLRSDMALRTEGLRLLHAMGEKRHTRVHADCGVEQEFFLVDRKYFLDRPDLRTCGRTLLGTSPPKGQELDDHYFGHVSERVLQCLEDAERELWRLGVPVSTRHCEVAPGQYEIAPVFAPAGPASDMNMLAMEVLRKIARRHEFAVLFHEKPFAGLNGSGKHNNWSVGTDVVPTLFEPGQRPLENPLFLTFLAATLRAVDSHADLLRVAISGASNDHRLGANEAPPAIVSVFLGDVADVLDAFVEGNQYLMDAAERRYESLERLGLPSFTGHGTNRNRTSPFAFTGNKFELRAVGSSQPPARSNMVLNTIVAESLQRMADDLEARVAEREGVSTPRQRKELAVELARETLQAHWRIVFNGNNYSSEWVEEAARRGLPNLRSTPDALAAVTDEKNAALFSKMSVLSPPELQARTEVMYEEYNKKLAVEARTVVTMARTAVLPAVFEYQTLLGGNIASLAVAAPQAAVQQQRQLLERICALSEELVAASEALDRTVDEVEAIEDQRRAATESERLLLPAMDRARSAADALEELVDRKRWPLPTYHDMLFNQD